MYLLLWRLGESIPEAMTLQRERVVNEVNDCQAYLAGYFGD